MTQKTSLETFPSKNLFSKGKDYIIYNGDCIDILKTFPKESVDLVITSPPYGNLRTYNTKDIKDIWTWDTFCGLAEELYRVLREGGVSVWVVGDQTINGSETLEPFKQAIFFKEEVGFKVWDTMIYYKPTYFISDGRNRYFQQFEFMFVLSKGKPKTINLIADIKNKQAGIVKSASRRREKGHTEKYTCKTRATRVRGNVWEYNVGYMHSTKDKIAYKHPAIFPEKLAEDHIKTWSKEGDIVLDPLCGSGTTLKAALSLGRKAIGIDINLDYCKITLERIKNTQPKLIP